MTERTDPVSDGTAVTFDCFGTLVEVPRPEDPAEAVRVELAQRGVPIPDDWTSAFHEPHVEVVDGAERSLPVHTGEALSSRGVEVDQDVVEAAVRDAYTAPVTEVPGATESVEAIEAPVGVLSNCAMPGLVERNLRAIDLLEEFDAVVTSVDCGWRKPDPRAFEAAASALDVPVEGLVHVGDDADADGGITDHGGRYLRVDDDLTGLATRLSGEGVL